MADRKATILIVDDDSNNRKLLEAQLAPAGYLTLAAASGEDALAMVARQAPDLILLDVMMPGMDGYQVAQRLKADPASKSIPIVMITSLGDRDSRLLGLDAGAEEFLSKPVDRAELWVRVRNLLRLKEYSDFLASYNIILEERVAERTRMLEGIKRQMIQSEKMAAVGLLAAGVAHEINTPAGYVYSNVTSLRGYIERLLHLLESYERVLAMPPEEMHQAVVELEDARKRIDPDGLKADLSAVLAETLEGIEHIIRIARDLKDFSHVDAKESWQPADLNKLLDTTLNVVKNELKYKAEIRKEYGDLPPVTCLGFQLNQVFMNLLVNAGQAIKQRGVISLRTGVGGDLVWVEVSDTGGGIQKEDMDKLFEPFFTTKPVGEGTGLGLWIAYGIVKKHQGRIEVDSELGVGAKFRIWLPIQPALPAESADPLPQPAPTTQASEAAR